MLLNNYYEDLSFTEGRIINTSRTIKGNYKDVNHWHPFVEILLCCKEGNEVSLNFRKHRMKPNDIVICFPGDLHSINNNSSDAFFIIQFPMKLISVIHDFNVMQQMFYKMPFCEYDPCNILHERMVSLIKEMVFLSESDEMFVDAKLYSLLLEFFSLFAKRCMNEHVDDSATDADRTKSSNLMAEACLYIMQNCTEPLTIEDVARQIGISRSYFSHLFKDYTQTTFVDYLTKERIRKAETLFLGPKMKLIDIAYECGFSSSSSFNRTFKKIKGMSPKDFRNAMIESLTQDPAKTR